VLSSNQRNKVFPAVQANGRPNTGSLSPGACPIKITLLETGPPLTGGPNIFGHSRHALSASTCPASGTTSASGSGLDFSRVSAIDKVEADHLRRKIKRVSIHSTQVLIRHCEDLCRKSQWDFVPKPGVARNELPKLSHPIRTQQLRLLEHRLHRLLLQVGLQLDESLGDGLFGVVKKGSVFLLEGAGVVVFFLVVDVVEQGVFLIHPNGENPISSAAER